MDENTMNPTTTAPIVDATPAVVTPIQPVVTTPAVELEEKKEEVPAVEETPAVETATPEASTV